MEQMRVLQPIISHQDSFIDSFLELICFILPDAPKEIVSGELEDERVWRIFKDAIVNGHLLQCCPRINVFGWSIITQIFQYAFP